ncbi:MAG: hypothetical protein ACE5DI_04200 [Candidatus Micrarchaeia archaeon]
MVEKVSAQTVEEIRMQLHTVDSKINLIAQKIKTIEKNQEVIGRTIVMHNDKIKKIDEGGTHAGKKTAPISIATPPSEDLQKVSEKVEDLQNQIKELKYVLDTINPLEYATIDQVKELLNEKLGKKD